VPQTDTRTSSIAARDAARVASALKVRYSPLVVVGGEGCRLRDADGRWLLDLSGMWAVASLGYSDPTVREAVTRQLDRSMVSSLISTINEPAVRLAERLASLLPSDDTRVWFGMSGSDAAEAAQRLVRRATGKPRLASFLGSWHGTTDAAMALSGHAAFAGAPGGEHVVKAPYPDPYRPPFDVPLDQLTDRCLSELESELSCGDVGAVFAEGIQADSGDVVPPDDFLPRLRAMCNSHGALLVLDEVKVGLGRTGRMCSFDHAGIRPDLILLGKALGGGLPISAVVGPSSVLDVEAGAALYTISGNATCCVAALATLDVIERDGLAARAERTGAMLLERLQGLRRHEVVGDVRGRGMILGVDLVSDRRSRTPDRSIAAKIVYRAWQLGLVLFSAGTHGNVLEITPPLILTRDEVDEAVDLLDRAIDDVVNGLVSDADIASFAGW